MPIPEPPAPPAPSTQPEPPTTPASLPAAALVPDAMPHRADEPWPADGLEALAACEVCGGTDRPLWLDGLSDRIFGAAPGVWQLRRCQGCGVAALDPRPTEATIGLAYQRYYTHDAGPERHFVVPGDRPDLPIKRALHAGYYNQAYGHRLSPAWALGRWWVGASAVRRAKAGHYIRHLPAPQTPGARLLDVGCGNGSYLRVAQALGYQAEGIEIDDAAAALARQGGFMVTGGALSAVVFEPGRFEHITLNHVIEHLHRPLAALQRLAGWLAPGGRIWLQTPNLAARGAAHYGRHWRGYEPPRHLVMFDGQSLPEALRAAGFERAELLPPQRDAGFFVRQSDAIREGRDPYAANRASPAQKRQARAWDRAALADWGSAEAITVQAWKPR